MGRYRLGRRLGVGGMAEVFVATHLGAAGFERPVCIKRILPHLSSDQQFRELFVKEARIAGRLSHAAIVQVFDCIEDGETLAIVMEYVDGKDLKALTAAMAAGGGELLPEGVVAHVAGQLLGALRFAHGQQVVHRDVSPHNVLVSRQGEVKLADFGVAKALLSQATRTGEIKGKLAYMSPEQARGEPVDARTDLYSTGLVLFELLRGERFFPSLGQAELVAAVLRAEQPRLEGVAPELAQLVEGLLAPRVEDRYPSAEAALRDLPPWELAGPLGAVELGAIVRRVQDEERAPATEEDRAIPSGLLRGSDPDGTEMLAGGTAVSPGSAKPERERRVVALPSDAPTITRSDDQRRLLEMAPTEEADSGEHLPAREPHDTVEDRSLEGRGADADAADVAGATTEALPAARRLGPVRLLLVVLFVAAVLGGAATMGYRLVASPGRGGTADGPAGAPPSAPGAEAGVAPAPGGDDGGSGVAAAAEAGVRPAVDGSSGGGRRGPPPSARSPDGGTPASAAASRDADGGARGDVLAPSRGGRGAREGEGEEGGGGDEGRGVFDVDPFTEARGSRGR